MSDPLLATDSRSLQRQRDIEVGAKWAKRLNRMQMGNAALAMMLAGVMWAFFAPGVAIAVAAGVMLAGVVAVGAYVERRVTREHRAIDEAALEAHETPSR